MKYKSIKTNEHQTIDNALQYWDRYTETFQNNLKSKRCNKMMQFFLNRNQIIQYDQYYNHGYFNIKKQCQLLYIEIVRSQFEEQMKENFTIKRTSNFQVKINLKVQEYNLSKLYFSISTFYERYLQSFILYIFNLIYYSFFLMIVQ